MLKSLAFILLTQICLPSIAQEQIDYAFSFSKQKLQPVNVSKDYTAIIIQEHCPACVGVYKLIDASKELPKNLYLSSTYEPSKRWIAKHKKYINKIGIYSAGNLIREEGVFARATPAVYRWDAKKKRGTLEYGMKAILPLFKSQ